MSTGTPDTPTPFRFRCPKCHTTQFTIERTGPSYRGKTDNAWHDKVMACLCGKRLYGEAIKKEYDFQLGAHAGRLEEEKREAARAKRRAAAEAMRAKAKSEAAQLARRAAAHARKEAEERVGPRLCSFSECTNVARARSMYCSRDCSNKNARARYAERKKGTG